VGQRERLGEVVLWQVSVVAATAAAVISVGTDGRLAVRESEINWSIRTAALVQRMTPRSVCLNPVDGVAATIIPSI
jgi:hypothetical protein